jgi:flagellar biosynthesis/type III secretory pathway ATPase
MQPHIQQFMRQSMNEAVNFNTSLQQLDELLAKADVKNS